MGLETRNVRTYRNYTHICTHTHTHTHECVVYVCKDAHTYVSNVEVSQKHEIAACLHRGTRTQSQPFMQNTHTYTHIHTNSKMGQKPGITVCSHRDTRIQSQANTHTHTHTQQENGPETWYCRVFAQRHTDPVTGEPIIMVSHQDVTNLRKVEGELGRMLMSEHTNKELKEKHDRFVCVCAYIYVCVYIMI